MADEIRERMERMLPGLHFFERHQLFSREETNSIFKNREDFEYSLMKFNSSPLEFLRAVEYELKLESKRRIRRIDLKLKQESHNDYQIVKRIYSLLDRALKKFPYDFEIFKLALRFAVQTASNKNFYRIFSAGEKRFGHNLDYWLTAVYYELEILRNPFKARLLFFRGVALNPQNAAFWTEYFFTEVKIGEMLGLRKKILEGAVASKKVEEKNPEEDLLEMSLEMSDAEETNQQNDKLLAELNELPKSSKPILEKVFEKMVENCRLSPNELSRFSARLKCLKDESIVTSIKEKMLKECNFDADSMDFERLLRSDVHLDDLIEKLATFDNHTKAQLLRGLSRLDLPACSEKALNLVLRSFDFEEILKFFPISSAEYWTPAFGFFTECQLAWPDFWEKNPALCAFVEANQYLESAAPFRAIVLAKSGQLSKLIEFFLVLIARKLLAKVGPKTLDVVLPLIISDLTEEKFEEIFAFCCKDKLLFSKLANFVFQPEFFSSLSLPLRTSIFSLFIAKKHTCPSIVFETLATFEDQNFVEKNLSLLKILSTSDTNFFKAYLLCLKRFRQLAKAEREMQLIKHRLDIKQLTDLENFYQAKVIG